MPAANPFLAWTQLALKTSEMMVASVHVIHHRTNRIAASGALPNARDRREFRRMGQEKIDAASESVQAVALRMVTVNQQLASIAFRQMLNATGGIISLLTGPMLVPSGRRQAEFLRTTMASSAAAASQVSGSIARLAHHGLKPIHSRATGNAKRLLKI